MKLRKNKFTHEYFIKHYESSYAKACRDWDKMYKMVLDGYKVWPIITATMEALVNCEYEVENSREITEKQKNEILEIKNSIIKE